MVGQHAGGSTPGPNQAFPIGGKIRWYRTLDSTNRRAMRLATEEAAEHGTVVLADHQTAGRGRLGRRWEDKPGASLLMSIVLRPQLPAERAGSLMLMGAVAVARAIRRATKLKACIKWPNDIVVDGKKVSGTLLETVTKESTVELAVLGIGVNCSQKRDDFDASLRDQATALALELDRCRVDRAVILDALLEELREQYRHVVAGEAAQLAEKWRELSDMLGQRVEVEPVTGQSFVATAEDITEAGLLVLNTGDGSRSTVAAGDVSVRSLATNLPHLQ